MPKLLRLRRMRERQLAKDGIFAARSALTLRLMERETARNSTQRFSQIRGIYADYSFVSSLNIVNELPGYSHNLVTSSSRCVNALDWSPSGEFLAAGGDDMNLQIYEYLPESSSRQFKLKFDIYTGHRQNIFAVSFMPHSDERKIVTASRDSQVRIFDLEHYDVTKHAQIFRCHTGPVKRIVTQNPSNFMTCSEDGTVRQWDLRIADLSYPPSWNEDAPPPLISYADFGLELSALSSSPNQPQYIAVGGSHLHCFLHDRRMLGRDKLRERGGGFRFVDSTNTSALETATRCVRKFAPSGLPAMKAAHVEDQVEITSCKISDAFPNEIVVSWRGKKIYTFDMLRDSQSFVKHHLGLTTKRYDLDLDHYENDNENVIDDTDSSDDAEQEEDDIEEYLHTYYKMAAERRVPCITHSRVYRGHINLDTTKDVNFFGLQDEYIVSGSDCGNLFIWDRQSCQVVNILHGDEEVVNVVQPHPYEPLLAVSGIDSTVKIFSADAKERKRAAMGMEIETEEKDRGEVPESLQTRLGESWVAEGEEGAEPENLQYERFYFINYRQGLKSRRRIQEIPAILTENWNRSEMDD